MEELDNEFTIDVDGRSYQVFALDDGTFMVMDGDELLCHIFADIGIDTEPKWATGDLVPIELVQAIGYAIEMRES